MSNEKGQSLLEVIVAVTVGILVVSALTFATIFSLRNANFAKASAQATKLAQEGLEKVRSNRDRGESINGFSIASNVLVSSWEDPNLWNYSISANCRYCYFKFNGSIFEYLGEEEAQNKIPDNPEDPLLDGRFERVIILSDSSDTAFLPDGTPISSYRVQKTATAIVTWTDFSGPHESRLTTILRRL